MSSETTEDEISPALQRTVARPSALRTIIALVLREMSTTYGKTPGGYLWALLEPLAAICILSLAFSLIVRTPPIGNSFILFFAFGYLPFGLFNSISNTVSRSIQFSKPLLRYPAVAWIDALAARFILNFATEISIAAIMMTGIVLMQDTRVVLHLEVITLAFGMAALGGLGVGALNCVLFGLFPIWQTVWSIFTRPLMLASGVLFLVDELPTFAQDLLWYNPLVHIIALSRTGIYPMYDPGFINIWFVLAVSMILLLLGLLFLRRYYKDILNA